MAWFGGWAPRFFAGKLVWVTESVNAYPYPRRPKKEGRQPKRKEPSEHRYNLCTAGSFLPDIHHAVMFFYFTHDKLAKPQKRMDRFSHPFSHLINSSSFSVYEADIITYMTVLINQVSFQQSLLRLRYFLSVR